MYALALALVVALTGCGSAAEQVGVGKKDDAKGSDDPADAPSDAGAGAVASRAARARRSVAESML